MRKYALLLLLLALAVVHAPAQSDKAKNPYTVEFDPVKDVKQLTHYEGKDGIFIQVQFSISFDGANADKLEGDYKIAIEENKVRVRVIDLPRPVVSEALSVVLAIDTSGSMQGHGRMEQARGAAKVFLDKLPARSDCGLILFDHEIRREKDQTGEEKGKEIKIMPIFQRQPLLQYINATEPRGGTAYLDAAYEGITMLSATARGRDRALVLMTDGIDLNSKKTINEVIAKAKKEGVRVYTVGIGEPGKLEQVNTVLALDHSGSMLSPADDFAVNSKIKALHPAVERYLDSMSSEGRVSIVPFSTQVNTPWNFQGRTKIVALKALIKKELEPGGELEAKGETALFDATYEAIGVLEAFNPPGKRAVLAMTDGVDNSSRRGVKEVIERAKAANIKLYLLGFGRANEIDSVTMQNMADATGGKFYHAKNEAALIEIFESLSIQLHDDGIDEDALVRIARETKGQYFHARDAGELKMRLETVTQSIPQKRYPPIIFESLNQRADGSKRDVTLKLIRTGAGGDEKTLDERTGGIFQRGLVVAEMNHFVYLILLIAIGGLIALPGLGRRSPVT
jgi:Mg-chelatase subunit ChlD